MTFDEIVTEVKARMNLTSAEATARVGRELNLRYKRVTTSCYLDTSRRQVVVSETAEGSREVEFEGVEKVLSVYYIATNANIVLDQWTMDDMTLKGNLGEGTPIAWAPLRLDSTVATIQLDIYAGSVITLYADCLVSTDTLAGAEEPVFPESFHDLLVEGVVADELKKMNKPQEARAAEADFEHRLSDLRMFIARSTYLRIQQGRDAKPLWNLRNRMV